MAHHCREHWASQHTWQTMPVEAAGQRSAGSEIWAPQSEQEGMVAGSGIFDAANTQAAATQPGGFIAELKRFGAVLELIGEGQAAELGQFAVVAPANAERPAAAVVGFDSVSGGHGGDAKGWNGSAKLTAPGGLRGWSGCLCQSLA